MHKDNILPRHDTGHQERCALTRWCMTLVPGIASLALPSYGSSLPCLEVGRHVLSTVPTPLGCWGLHLFGNQGKTQRELNGKYSQVPLFPLPLKCKAEQSSITFFSIHQSSFLVLRTERWEITGTTAVCHILLPMIVWRKVRVQR